MSFLIVALGSALGGVLRYWLSNVVYNFLPATFPFGTMLVNFAGSFIIGATIFGLSDRGLISQDLRLFLTVGFCGGFTTFSTFSLETVNLLRNSEYILAGVNIGLSLIICLAATFLAFVIFSQEQ
ncbi:MAG: fluoride efflux transporter CrcB [Bacteroidetes bacterium]|nr:fluoride efflux transporter CrcB [Bacteroidota bacterium]